MATNTPEICVPLADVCDPKADLAYRDPETTIQNMIAAISINCQNSCNILAQLQSAQEEIRAFKSKSNSDYARSQQIQHRLMRCLLAGRTITMNLTPVSKTHATVTNTDASEGTEQVPGRCS